MRIVNTPGEEAPGDDGEEEDCPRCDGNEGWYVWPEPSPSLTLVDLDASPSLPRRQSRRPTRLFRI